MTERDELGEVCRWNGRLAQENLQLREVLRWMEQRCRVLSDANADLAASLDACDGMLGAAMDRALAER
jgi:hypothetical protein